MIALFLLSLFTSSEAANCTVWSMSSTVGYYASPCSTNTGSLPSSECGYNYVCNNDPNVCFSNGSVPMGTGPLVCTTFAGNSVAKQSISGYPCNTDVDCAANHFCGILGTASFPQFNNAGAGWTQAAYPSSPLQTSWNGGSYKIGVCYVVPPAGANGRTYDNAFPACNSHNDCKYQVQNKNGTVVGGNSYSNYMCWATSSTMCEEIASCHPVSHQCEQYGTTTYYNGNCYKCTTASPSYTCDSSVVNACVAGSTGRCCSRETACANGGTIFVGCS